MVKDDKTVVANYEILMDYYKAYADELTPQPIIKDVELNVRNKYCTFSFGVVSIKFVYVTPTHIELRVLNKFGSVVTILVSKLDTELELHITYRDDINY